jgi:4-hydroxy-2-oxoheptanedioate aldolase
MRTIKERLEDRSPLLGLSAHYGTPAIIETIGPHWDWVWIDIQHGRIDEKDVEHMVMACDLADAAAVVRVASNETGAIGRALDTDCAGVIVPQVDTPEEARQAVIAAKFPPIGDRSYGGRRVIDRGGREYVETANADRMLIVQIESPQAVENADAIAAIEGVDALFLGPDDLTMRRGGPSMEGMAAADIQADMDAVTSACRQHGKVAVTVAFSEEKVVACAESGHAMIVASSDVVFLRNASRPLSESLRKALEQTGAPDSLA